MAIVKMKRLRLLAMTEDREKLLGTLQKLGCVEVCELTAQAWSADTKTAELLDQLTAPDSQALSMAQTRRQEAPRKERRCGA